VDSFTFPLIAGGEGGKNRHTAVPRKRSTLQRLLLTSTTEKITVRTRTSMREKGHAVVNSPRQEEKKENRGEDLSCQSREKRKITWKGHNGKLQRERRTVNFGRRGARLASTFSRKREKEKKIEVAGFLSKRRRRRTGTSQSRYTKGGKLAKG